MLKVLMIGNDNSVKGGITSVITQILSYDWEKRDIDMTFIPSYKEGNAIYKSIYFVFSYIRIVIYSIIKRPDVVHMHMSYRGSFTRKYILSRWFKLIHVPVIIHLHGSQFEKWYNEVSLHKQKKIRSFLRECDLMLVLGEKWKNIIYKIEPECKTKVVENTISIPNYTVKWNANVCRFLFMGVLIKRKGVHDLIEAVKNIVERENEEKFIFEIAGVGEEEIALKKQVKDYELKPYFEFTGWVDGTKKEQCYKNANVMVLPSYNEGLPIAILEAISYGMPVIATDVGDISSAVHDGRNGYLFQPGDTNTLAEDLVNIMDKEKYEEFSEYSKRLAIEKFNEDKYFDILVNVYQKKY